MQFKSLWECPNQDEEVRAKHIVDTDHEPIPPLASERGELIELDDELMEDSIVANVSGVDANAQNVRKMPLQWEELTCQAKSWQLMTWRVDMESWQEMIEVEDMTA